jgi:hypothetical protein
MRRDQRSFSSDQWLQLAHDVLLHASDVGHDRVRRSVFDHFFEGRTHRLNRHGQHYKVRTPRRFDRVARRYIDHAAIDGYVKVRLRPSKAYNFADDTRAPRDKRERASNQAHSAHGHLSK